MGSQSEKYHSIVTYVILFHLICVSTSGAVAPRAQRAWQQFARLRTENDSQNSLCSRNTKRYSCARQDAEIFQEFLEHYHNLQDACGSSSATAEYRNIVNRVDGLGSQLNAYVLTSTSLLLRGLVGCEVDSHSVYINRQRCDKGGWQCILRPLSSSKSCEACQTGVQPQVLLRKQESLRCPYMRDPQQERSFSNGLSFTFHNNMINTTFVRTKYPDHWYLKEIYRYLLTPSNTTQTFINAISREIGLDHEHDSYIAMHIRRADHWMGQKHHSDEEYMQVLTKVLKKTKAQVVLLCSDDFRVFRSIPQMISKLPDFENVRVVHIPHRLTVLSAYKDQCQGRNRKCYAAKYLKTVGEDQAAPLVSEFPGHDAGETIKLQYDEGMTMFAQIWLLSRAQVTIGTLASNLGRVAYMLQWGHQHHRNCSGGYWSQHPGVRFIDMNGDMYWACGWRKSAHLPAASIGQVTELWSNRWDRYDAETSSDTPNSMKTTT